MECAVLNNSGRFKLLSAGDQAHSASFCLAPGNRVGMRIPVDQYVDLFENLKILTKSPIKVVWKKMKEEYTHELKFSIQLLISIQILKAIFQIRLSEQFEGSVKMESRLQHFEKFNLKNYEVFVIRRNLPVLRSQTPLAITNFLPTFFPSRITRTS